jgi:hypothetical protein
MVGMVHWKFIRHPTKAQTGQTKAETPDEEIHLGANSPVDPVDV